VKKGDDRYVVSEEVLQRVGLAAGYDHLGLPLCPIQAIGEVYELALSAACPEAAHEEKDGNWSSLGVMPV
jgi:hypothetical protein